MASKNIVPDSDVIPEEPQGATPQPEGSPAPGSTVPDSDVIPQDTVPDSDVITNEEKYSTPSQQALTVGEGSAAGLITSPVVSGIEAGLNKIGVPSMTPEDIKGRATTNPLERNLSEAGTFGGSLLIPGLGEYTAAGRLSALGAHVAPEVLGKAGSLAFRGLMEQGGSTAGDEISKAMTGQGDPNHPVSSMLLHTGAAGVLGFGIGGAFGTVNATGTKGLQILKNSEMANKAISYLEGMGAASKLKELGQEPVSRAEALEMSKELNNTKLLLNDTTKEGDHGAFAQGVYDLQQGLAEKSGKTVAGAVGVQAADLASRLIPSLGAYGTVAVGGAAAKAANEYIAPTVERITGQALTRGNKYIGPAIENALSKGETSGLYNVTDYASKVSKGAQDVSKALDTLFKGGVWNVMKDNSKEKDMIDDYLDQGGVDKQIQESTQLQQQQEAPPGMAEGGAVHKQPVTNEIDPITKHFPDQGVLLSTAKGRISNYLNSLRPQPHPKLTYDTQHEDPFQERKYDRALDIATRPLSVLKHIQDGTLQAEHMQHLIGMYPEAHQHLSQKITERIVQQQLDKEKPNYKTRMGLSLFLGAPMDSTMLPASIQAAQPMPQQPPPQAPGKPMKGRKGTSSLGKSAKESMTPTQSAESDRTNRD